MNWIRWLSCFGPGRRKEVRDDWATVSDMKMMSLTSRLFYGRQGGGREAAGRMPWRARGCIDDGHVGAATMTAFH